MSRIFISYRREEAWIAEPVYATLVAEFTTANVFMDRNMTPGVIFPHMLMERIDDACAAVIVIGPRWLQMLRERVGRTDPDYVEMEIQRALAREPAVPVIPAVAKPAEMPREQELPRSIQSLSCRHAIYLQAGPDSDASLLRLCGALRETLDVSPGWVDTVRNALHAGDHERATRAASDLVAERPDLCAGHYYLAIAQLDGKALPAARLHAVQNAARLASKAQALDPHDGRVYLLLAALSHHLSRNNLRSSMPPAAQLLRCALDRKPAEHDVRELFSLLKIDGHFYET